ILLHLYWNAFKNEKSTLLQESREESFLGIQVEDSHWGWMDITAAALADGTDLLPTLEFTNRDEPFHPEDQTVARLVFPRPLQPGEAIHLELAFEAKIPRGLLRSGYYRDSYFIAQWFPKPGVYEEGKGWNCHAYHLNSEFFADFADFTVRITVPARYVVGASGKQVSAVSDREGKKVAYTFEQKDIHDFAWTAAPDFIKVERDFIAAKEVPEEEYQEVARRLDLPVEEIRLPDVKMILLIKPEHKSQVERHFKALRAAIKYYGLWYGPYPYETVTMVDPPFRTASGGMEYPTLFTAGTGLLRDKKVLSPESVIIHEFGHGYWYGLVANNEFEEAWLDEGINTYSTGKVLARAYGPGMVSVSLFGLPLTWFFNFPVHYDYERDRIGAILTAEFDPITTFSWRFYNRASYGLNVYLRASTCLYTLERLLGEDLMLRVLRAFQMRFRFKHPRTEDFIGVVNEVAGRDMRWFFEEFFFNTLNFDYGIATLRSAEKKEFFRGIFDANGKKEEITRADVTRMKKAKPKEKGEKLYVTEVKVRRYGEVRVRGEARVKLRVLFEDGSEELRFWDGQARWEKYVIEKPARAVSAEVDPDFIWIIDSNLANNSVKMKPCRSGVLRTAAQIMFWIQCGLSGLWGLS
ncbi:MAG: M1 family metallopeptidase, partial [Candidatus Aminicenantes bacterium]|nr:M1 family metallopeptidase [Candidatus Aminicenantes bacterium]